MFAELLVGYGGWRWCSMTVELERAEFVRCVCCNALMGKRCPDPWEGRLDDYCTVCAGCRCDAYPGHCETP